MRISNFNESDEDMGHLSSTKEIYAESPKKSQILFEDPVLEKLINQLYDAKC